MNAKFTNLSLKKHSYTWLLLLFLVLVATSILILASVPPVSRDALTHHLFVPRLYLEHGGIYEIPTIPFSYYPMNLDLLYMIPLYFGNDIFPKYIHFFFALLTALLIYTYLRERISIQYGLLGALFFLSIPIIIKLSITVYVDLGLMFFSTASLLLLLRWLRDKYKLGFLLSAGICCGLAAGTKYNGLVTLFVLSLFTPVLYIRSRQGARGSSSKAIGYAFLFITASLLAYSPWMIRNYNWTGNPIYPLHNTFFQQITPDNKGAGTASQRKSEHKQSLLQKMKNLSNSGGNVFANRKILYHETWWQTLLLPVRFFFQGQDDNPRYFDGKLNPFLFLLPFFAILKKSDHRRDLEKYALLSFAILFFFFTFFQEAMRIRYIVTIVPSLVILSIMGLHNITTGVQKLFPKRGSLKTLLPGLIILPMLAYNGRYIIEQFRIVQPLSYLSGKIGRDQYITKFRPEYPVIQYANHRLTTTTKVLCLFLGNRGYYMHFQPIFQRPGRNIFFENAFKKRAANDIRNELIHREIKYILMRDDLAINWYQHLEKDKQQAVSNFFSHFTKRLFSHGGYSFYTCQDQRQDKQP